MIIGAIVNSSGSTLSCPNWPTCYGAESLDPGVFYHHLHRALGMIVGILTFLALNFATKSKNKAIIKKAGFAFFLVVLQGIVGALAAVYKLPTIVAVLHLGLSIIFIFQLSRILKSLRLEEITIKKDELENWNPLNAHLFYAGGFLFLIQSLLGALVKHTGSSSSCGIGVNSHYLCFDKVVNGLSFWPTMQASQLNTVHRFNAFIVFILFLYCTHFIFHFLRKRKTLKKLSLSFLLVPLLLTFQIGFGIASLKYDLVGLYTNSHLVISMIFTMVFGFCFESLVKIQSQVIPEKSHSILSDFYDLSKPRLTLLVVVSSFIGLFMTVESINFFRATLGIFAITIVVVGAATLNCYLEKDVDAQMDRTKDRPLPSGRMKPMTALAYGAITSIIGFYLLFVEFNLYVGFATLFASLSYVAAYTPLKTRSTISLLVGAIPGAIPPLLGYLLVTNNLNLAVVSVFLLIFFWQFPHFFSISIFHGKDYEKANIQVHTNKMSFDSAQRFIFYSTPFVVLISFIPLFNNYVGQKYVYAASLLGLAFIWTGHIKKPDKNSTEKQKLWARRYFFASIIYLPLVMFSMVLLR